MTTDKTAEQNLVMDSRTVASKTRSRIIRRPWSRSDAIRAKKFQEKRSNMIARFRASGRTYTHAEAENIVAGRRGDSAKFNWPAKEPVQEPIEAWPFIASPELHALLMRDSREYREAHIKNFGSPTGDYFPRMTP